MTDDLIIAVTPMGTIIGKQKEGKNGFYLKDPRIVFPVQNPETGQTALGLQRLPGNPSLLFIPSSNAYYAPDDAALADAYLRSTTGLVLASSGSN
jgi:hypothetical protein